MMMKQKLSYISGLTIIEFSHEGTCIQHLSFLAIWCNDYLLFLMWKWIMVKVFILIVSTLIRLGRRKRKSVGFAVSGSRGTIAGESQGRGSLVGCRLWGRTESDTTEETQQQHTEVWPVCIEVGVVRA